MKGLISSWDINVEEVSNGCYKVEGFRISGESFSAHSSDPITELRNLGMYAKDINSKYKRNDYTHFFIPFYDTDLHKMISEKLEYIILLEIWHHNHITEYWTGYGSCMKLHNKLSQDSLNYVSEQNLNREIKNNCHWGMSEISDRDCEWRIIEPYFVD